MDRLNVLVTAAGSPTWPRMAHCLKNNGEREITLIGVDMCIDPTILEYLDKVYKVPGVYEADYLDCLIDICKNEEVDILIPGMSQELELIAKRIDDFRKIGVIVSITNEKSLNVANNKIRLFDYLKSEGLTMPKYTVVDSVKDVVSACYEIGYPENPVCIKIADGAGSRGVRVIDPNISRFDLFINEKPNCLRSSLNDFVDMLKEAYNLPKLMVMEYLPGPEYCVDLLADNGKVKYIAGQKTQRLQDSTPIESVVEKDDFVYKQSIEIVEKLNLDGNIGLDYRYNKNGFPRITEINPRITQAMSLVEAAGVDLLYLRIKQLIGEELPNLNVKYGTKMRRRYLESFYTDE